MLNACRYPLGTKRTSRQVTPKSAYDASGSVIDCAPSTAFSTQERARIDSCHNRPMISSAGSRHLLFHGLNCGRCYEFLGPAPGQPVSDELVALLVDGNADVYEAGRRKHCF